MAIIPQLPVMQQVIVRMHHMQEMETEDIASVLGISEAAVRMSVSRARKRLRDIYNKQKPQL
jgi:RNA polymerase sigma factor (sigma-70 family)